MTTRTRIKIAVGSTILAVALFVVSGPAYLACAAHTATMGQFIEVIVSTMALMALLFLVVLSVMPQPDSDSATKKD